MVVGLEHGTQCWKRWGNGVAQHEPCSEQELVNVHFDLASQSSCFWSARIDDLKPLALGRVQNGGVTPLAAAEQLTNEFFAHFGTSFSSKAKQALVMTNWTVESRKLVV